MHIRFANASHHSFYLVHHYYEWYCVLVHEFLSLSLPKLENGSFAYLLLVSREFEIAFDNRICQVHQRQSNGLNLFLMPIYSVVILAFIISKRPV